MSMSLSDLNVCMLTHLQREDSEGNRTHKTLLDEIDYGDHTSTDVLSPTSSKSL